jgi:hypothetical protein
MKHRPNISVKRIGPSHATSRRSRGGSLVSTFVVPDNVVHLDSEVSSSDMDSSDTSIDESDSDTEMTGTVPETIEVLRINMKPRWAYNEKIIVKSKR